MPLATPLQILRTGLDPANGLVCFVNSTNKTCFYNRPPDTTRRLHPALLSWLRENGVLVKVLYGKRGLEDGRLLQFPNPRTAVMWKLKWG